MSNRGYFVFPQPYTDDELGAHLNDINDRCFQSLLAIATPPTPEGGFQLAFQGIDEHLFQMWRETPSTVYTEHRNHFCAYWVQGLIFNELARLTGGHSYDDATGLRETGFVDTYPSTFAQWMIAWLQRIPRPLSRGRKRSERKLFDTYEALFVPPPLRGEWTLR